MWVTRRLGYGAPGSLVESRSPSPKLQWKVLGVASILVLPVYVVESALLTWLAGGSVGKLLTGLCVVPADGRLRKLNPLKALGRQVMVALVIPPLVFRADGRGLHDLFAGTSTVTFATLRTLLK